MATAPILPLKDLVLAPVSSDDLPSLCALEASSYPPDEAATPAKLAFRAASAPDFFRVAWATKLGGPGEAAARVRVGFVTGTLTAGEVLREEDMSAHDAAGTTLCIHSVVVDAAWRRAGLGRWLVRGYLASVAVAAPAVKQVLLLTHAENEALYAAAGFVSRGVSAVHHGGTPWLEMARPLLPHDRLPALYHVDAFTLADGAGVPVPLTGNPAAIVMLPPGTPLPGDSYMQAMAAEMALPVTAFVAPRAADGCFDVRYFTPTTELPLCGHASLAAGRALWRSGALPPCVRAATLTTRGGIRIIVAADDAAVTLTLPADAPRPLSADEVAAVLPALPALFGLPPARLQPVTAGAGGSGLVAVGRNTRDMVLVVTPDVFRDMAVKPTAAAGLDGRIISVTTAGGAGATADDDAPRQWRLTSGYAGEVAAAAYESVSRCFSPATGTPEDPACGAAHCGIVPFMRTLFPRPTSAAAAGADGWFAAFQASPRGAAMQARLASDGATLELRGTTAVVMAGHVTDAAWHAAAAQ